jgi:hypothetical protein
MVLILVIMLIERADQNHKVEFNLLVGAQLSTQKYPLFDIFII